LVTDADVEAVFRAGTSIGGGLDRVSFDRFDETPEPPPDPYDILVPTLSDRILGNAVSPLILTLVSPMLLPVVCGVNPLEFCLEPIPIPTPSLLSLLSANISLAIVCKPAITLVLNAKSDAENPSKFFAAN
jgi:hypothetical protein